MFMKRRIATRLSKELLKKKAFSRLMGSSCSETSSVDSEVKSNGAAVPVPVYINIAIE